MLNIAQQAKEASRKLAFISTSIKNNALMAMAAALRKEKGEILKANKKDLSKARHKGYKESFVDRLRLDEARILDMVNSLREVVHLPDPVGSIIKKWRLSNGLEITKIRVPIGVIAIIYESRPNVTVDAVALTLKSGNSVILRGGSEAYHSNQALQIMLSKAATSAGIPQGAVAMIATGHKVVEDLLQLDKYIDLVIPRGGESLIKRVLSLSHIPVIKHYKGLCHVYVDKGAKMEMAEKIIINAKIQRPGVCNAMETLLVHKDIAEKYLPRIAAVLKTKGVELRGCPLTCKILRDIKKAAKIDWETEYLDLILSIKVVKDLDEAIEHINTYGSGLSEAILTTNYTRAKRFTEEIDSACVYVNASTRFTDGNQFGLSAEIGISTDRIHARGPMGLEELTSYKYIVRGKGQVRK
ncbi:MAG: glutamate-5-semialdehyde dehydrogenase [Candidatus Omnitrophica bacterium]|nr:glutamate-5-semialdehyde dehydrogenase [Candidatus Omnitrophota bacterium]